MNSSTLKSIGWTVLFGGIFALSLNYWTWGEPIERTVFNYPQWLLYFGGLQLVFALAILLFNKYYWPKDD